MTQQPHEGIIPVMRGVSIEHENNGTAVLAIKLITSPGSSCVFFENPRKLFRKGVVVCYDNKTFLITPHVIFGYVGQDLELKSLRLFEKPLPINFDELEASLLK